MEGTVQLMANYEDWKAIKKITITDATDPLVIAEFLASLTYSVDFKIEDNLRKAIDLKKVDDAIKALDLGKKDVGRSIDEVNSRTVSKVIGEVCKLDKFSGPQQKELVQLCKVYATKKAIRACGILTDYYEADIATLKRAKKNQAKKELL